MADETQSLLLRVGIDFEALGEFVEALPGVADVMQAVGSAIDQVQLGNPDTFRQHGAALTRAIVAGAQAEVAGLDFGDIGLAISKSLNPNSAFPDQLAGQYRELYRIIKTEVPQVTTDFFGPQATRGLQAITGDANLAQRQVTALADQLGRLRGEMAALQGLTLPRTLVTRAADASEPAALTPTTRKALQQAGVQVPNYLVPDSIRYSNRIGQAGANLAGTDRVLRPKIEELVRTQLSEVQRFIANTTRLQTALQPRTLHEALGTEPATQMAMFGRTADQATAALNRVTQAAERLTVAQQREAALAEVRVVRRGPGSYDVQDKGSDRSVQIVRNEQLNRRSGQYTGGADFDRNLVLDPMRTLKEALGEAALVLRDARPADLSTRVQGPPTQFQLERAQRIEAERAAARGLPRPTGLLSKEEQAAVSDGSSRPGGYSGARLRDDREAAGFYRPSQRVDHPALAADAPLRGVTQLVSVAELRRYQEFDRAGDAGHSESRAIIDSIKESFARGKGLTEPVRLAVNPAEGTALLHEGNHRLTAAIESGLTELPARIEVVTRSLLRTEALAEQTSRFQRQDLPAGSALRGDVAHNPAYGAYPSVRPDEFFRQGVLPDGPSYLPLNGRSGDRPDYDEYLTAQRAAADERRRQAALAPRPAPLQTGDEFLASVLSTANEVKASRVQVLQQELDTLQAQGPPKVGTRPTHEEYDQLNAAQDAEENHGTPLPAAERAILAQSRAASASEEALRSYNDALYKARQALEQATAKELLAGGPLLQRPDFRVVQTEKDQYLPHGVYQEYRAQVGPHDRPTNVGELTARRDGGSLYAIEHVEVPQEFQRQGVGVEMFRQARAQLNAQLAAANGRDRPALQDDLFHHFTRTNAGEAFARAAGGREIYREGGIGVMTPLGGVPLPNQALPSYLRPLTTERRALPAGTGAAPVDYTRAEREANAREAEYQRRTAAEHFEAGSQLRFQQMATIYSPPQSDDYKSYGKSLEIAKRDAVREAEALARFHANDDPRNQSAPAVYQRRFGVPEGGATTDPRLYELRGNPLYGPNHREYKSGRLLSAARDFQNYSHDGTFGTLDQRGINDFQQRRESFHLQPIEAARLAAEHVINTGQLSGIGPVNTLLHAVATGAPVEHPLYRGVSDLANSVGGYAEQLGALKPGDSLTLPLSSFTSDKQVAQEFLNSQVTARLNPYGEVNKNHTIFQTEPGARGLDLPGLTGERRDQQETVLAGRYQVLSSTQERGANGLEYRLIQLRQLTAEQHALAQATAAAAGGPAVRAALPAGTGSAPVDFTSEAYRVAEAGGRFAQRLLAVAERLDGLVNITENKRGVLSAEPVLRANLLSEQGSPARAADVVNFVRSSNESILQGLHQQLRAEALLPGATDVSPQGLRRQLGQNAYQDLVLGRGLGPGQTKALSSEQVALLSSMRVDGPYLAERPGRRSGNRLQPPGLLNVEQGRREFENPDDRGRLVTPSPAEYAQRARTQALADFNARRRQLELTQPTMDPRLALATPLRPFQFSPGAGQRAAILDAQLLRENRLPLDSLLERRPRPVLNAVGNLAEGAPPLRRGGASSDSEVDRARGGVERVQANIGKLVDAGATADQLVPFQQQLQQAEQRLAQAVQASSSAELVHGAAARELAAAETRAAASAGSPIATPYRLPANTQRVLDQVARERQAREQAAQQQRVLTGPTFNRALTPVDPEGLRARTDRARGFNEDIEAQRAAYQARELIAQQEARRALPPRSSVVPFTGQRTTGPRPGGLDYAFADDFFNLGAGARGGGARGGGGRGGAGGGAGGGGPVPPAPPTPPGAPAPAGPPSGFQRFLGGAKEGFRGKDDGDPFAFFGKSLGSAARFSLVYGAAYTALHLVTQGFSEGVRGAIAFETALTDLNIATERTGRSNEGLATSLANISSSRGFDGAEGVAAGARAIGLFDAADSSKADQERIARVSTDVATKAAFGGTATIEQVQTQLAGLTRSFNLNPLDQGSILDSATYVARRSGRNTGDLLQAAGQIGTLGETGGFSLDQILAIVARLTSTTGQTPQAVSGFLSQVLSKADDPNVERSLSQAGVNTDGTTLAQQLAELSKKNLPEGERNQLVQAFGRGRSGQALSIILSQFDQIQGLANGAAGSKGLADKTFDQQLGTVGGQLRVLGSRLKDLFVGLAESGLLDVFVLMIKAANGVVGALNTVVDLFNAIPRPIRTVAFALGELGAALLLLGRFGPLAGRLTAAAGVSAAGGGIRGAGAFLSGLATAGVGAARTAGSANVGTVFGNLAGAFVRRAPVTYGVSTLSGGVIGAAGPGVINGVKTLAGRGLIEAGAAGGGLALTTLGIVTAGAAVAAALYGVARTIGESRAVQNEIRNINNHLAGSANVGDLDNAQREIDQARKDVAARKDFKFLSKDSLTLGLGTLYGNTLGSTDEQAAQVEASQKRLDDLRKEREVEAKSDPASAFESFSADSITQGLQKLSDKGLTAADQLGLLNQALDGLITKATPSANAVGVLYEGQGAAFGRTIAGRVTKLGLQTTADARRRANQINPYESGGFRQQIVGGTVNTVQGVINDIASPIQAIAGGFGSLVSGQGFRTGALGAVSANRPSLIGEAKGFFNEFNPFADNDREKAAHLRSAANDLNKYLTDPKTQDDLAQVSTDVLLKRGKDPSAGPVSLTDSDVQAIQDAQIAFITNITGGVPKEVREAYLKGLPDALRLAIGDFNGVTIDASNVQAYVKSATDLATQAGKDLTTTSGSAATGSQETLKQLQDARQRTVDAAATAATPEDRNAILATLKGQDINIAAAGLQHASDNADARSQYGDVLKSQLLQGDKLGQNKIDRDTLAGEAEDAAKLGPEGFHRRQQIKAQQAALDRQDQQDQLDVSDAKSLNALPVRNVKARNEQQLANLSERLKTLSPDSTDYQNVVTQMAQLNDQAAQYALEYASITAQIGDPTSLGDNPENALLGAQREVEDAQRALDDANTTGDPLAIAKATRAKQLADRKLARGKVTTQQAKNRLGVNPLDDVGNAQADLNDALDDLSLYDQDSEEYYKQLLLITQKRIEVSQKEAERANRVRRLGTDLSDPVAQARNALQDAQDALDLKHQNDPGGDDSQEQLDLRQRQIDAESANHQAIISHASTAESLGRISHAAYVRLLTGEQSRLQDLLALYKAQGKDTQYIQDELDDTAQKLKDARQSLSGQFNLGDITVPSVYDVRREAANSQGPAGLVGSTATTTTINQISINGADTAQVKTFLAALVGPQAFATTAVNAPRV